MHREITAGGHETAAACTPNDGELSSFSLKRMLAGWLAYARHVLAWILGSIWAPVC